MAKRELIEREKLINELTESSKYHAQTSREESLLYRDRQIVREQPTITEQDIVKPILDKIKTEVKDIAFDWQEIDGEHESFMVVDLNDALNIIDKYKAESEG